MHVGVGRLVLIRPSLFTFDVYQLIGMARCESHCFPLASNPFAGEKLGEQIIPITGHPTVLIAVPGRQSLAPLPWLRCSHAALHPQACALLPSPLCHCSQVGAASSILSPLLVVPWWGHADHERHVLVPLTLQCSSDQSLDVCCDGAGSHPRCWGSQAAFRPAWALPLKMLLDRQQTARCPDLSSPSLALDCCDSERSSHCKTPPSFLCLLLSPPSRMMLCTHTLSVPIAFPLYTKVPMRRNVSWLPLSWMMILEAWKSHKAQCSLSPCVSLVFPS